MKPYYYVLRVGGGAPTVKHETLQAAHVESLRLAQANPGHTFEILQCLGQTRMQNPTTFWNDGVIPPHSCQLKRAMNGKCLLCGKTVTKF
jgi:hypothetical protein